MAEVAVEALLAVLAVPGVRGALAEADQVALPELDQEAQQKIYRQLTYMDLQLFVSNIDDRLPEGLQTKEFKMFHVEHGTIKPRNFS